MFGILLGILIYLDLSPQAGCSPVKIQIKFAPQLAPYILTKPIHQSQKIITVTPDRTIIELAIIPNFEFESLILSYGEQAEIISQGWIRDKILSRLKTLLELYQVN